jgi:PAS domain S-box-containing protein
VLPSETYTHSERPAAPAGAAADLRWTPRHTLSLAARVDEAAAALHVVGPAKMLLCVVAGLVSLLVLPRSACVAWVVCALGIEVWGWFASRPGAPAARPIRRARAVNFVASYVVSNLWWLFLSALFWRTGSLQGHAAGAVGFLAVTSVCVLLFYNAPVVYLVTGSAPAVAVIAVLAMTDGHGWREMLPIWLMLALSSIFNLGRALDTPSAQQAQRRLNDSLNNYEILAENVTDIIARSDMSGVHQYISPASFKVLGYRPDELIGMVRRDLVHPDSHALVVAAIARMVADPTRSEVVVTQVRHKDGHWLWLETSAKLLCEDGVPVGIIDVSHDVTERLAADAALREAKSEAEAATRAKAEFLANVSHEIRTPMNGVLGAMHLLERENISSEGRELMRHAQDSGRMLSQLLNDVLDFSKIEAGQLDLAAEPMRPAEALEAVTVLLDGQARAKGVELRCEVEGGDLWIEADPLRVRQAMFNLIGNAVKFTAQGHVIARLVMAAGDEGQVQVSLEVEDTGIGMTEEAQAHLFERFQQAEGDTARRFGGTGLGLSITQALARLMGGEIQFSSAEGEGSCFRLTFSAPAAEPARLEPAADGLLEGISILLVEDNPTNRLVARTMLTRLGANVDEAEDGVAGLEAARAGAYDLILMDVQMPHMDGVTATRAIRGLVGPFAHVPIIGLTANVMVHQKAEYLAAGMDGVVAKPISPAALLGEIARVIDKRDEQPLAEMAG